MNIQTVADAITVIFRDEMLCGVGREGERKGEEGENSVVCTISPKGLRINEEFKMCQTFGSVDLHVVDQRCSEQVIHECCQAINRQRPILGRARTKGRHQ